MKFVVLSVLRPSLVMRVRPSTQWNLTCLGGVYKRCLRAGKIQNFDFMHAAAVLHRDMDIRKHDVAAH